MSRSDAERRPAGPPARRRSRRRPGRRSTRRPSASVDSSVAPGSVEPAPAAARPGRPPPGGASRTGRAGASIVPSCTTRPWSITTSRRHSRSMSARSCVVSTSVVSPPAPSSARNAADRLLADHVQADRRLVQEQHLGAVQQRRGQLAAHPLAQRELPDRGVEERVQVEQRRGSGAAGPRARRPAPGRCAAAASNDSRSGRSHHSWERWPKTTPIRRASRGALRHRRQPADPTRARRRASARR